MRTAKQARLQTVTRSVFIHNRINRLMDMFDTYISRQNKRGFQEYTSTPLNEDHDVLDALLKELTELGYQTNLAVVHTEDSNEYVGTQIKLSWK